MQTPKETSTLNELTELYARQSQLQYTAMAHELAGQQLPAEFTREYEAVRSDIKTELLKRMSDLQYGAMANALSGLPSLRADEIEFAQLERKLEQL